jgi:folate-dependent phosphoribosylglycinamide formyltransferase PurN
MTEKKIIMLCGKGFSTNAVYHAINAVYPIAKVVVEEKVNTKEFLKRRIKKLGFITVAGQVLFQAIIVRMLNAASKKRTAQLVDELQLNGNEIPATVVSNVNSINDEEVIALLQQMQPHLVIVNGTRIISKKVLSCVQCRFINTHAGITPKYRGVHGTYWALANKDLENSGVTVHLVDAGIDTGSVLYQAVVKPTAKDNFVTYPILQLAAGIPLLKQAVADALGNNIITRKGTAESKLWSHPTIWQYLRNRIFKKVK